MHRLEKSRADSLADLADFNESSFEMYILRDGSVDLYMQDRSDQSYLISTLKLSEKTANEDPSSHRGGALPHVPLRCPCNGPLHLLCWVERE